MNFEDEQFDALLKKMDKEIFGKKGKKEIEKMIVEKTDKKRAGEEVEVFVCLSCREITTNPLLSINEEKAKEWLTLPEGELKWRMEQTREGFLIDECPHCRQAGQIVKLDLILDQTLSGVVEDGKKGLITIRSLFRHFRCVHKYSKYNKVKK